MELCQKYMESGWQYAQKLQMQKEVAFMFSWREKTNGLKVYEELGSFGRPSHVKSAGRETVK